MNKEAKFSVLKGYIDCETSVLNSKVDLSIELLKKNNNWNGRMWKQRLGNYSEKDSFFAEGALAK